MGELLQYLRPLGAQRAQTLVTRPADTPRLIAIAMVKNEGDIIRAWVSHVLSLFDEIYVVDHVSTDGTREFLLQVAQRHDKVHVFSFDHPGYFQQEITNYLGTAAAATWQDAWVFPLDADEFLLFPSRNALLSCIESVNTTNALALAWKNCIPVSLIEDDEFTLLSPCLIPPFLGSYKKLALHATDLLHNNWRFLQGNHEVQDGTGRYIGEEARKDIGQLLHIPIRSLAHFLLKCVQGYLAYRSLPPARRDPRQGFHWTEMINRVLQKKTLSPNLVREFVVRYGEPQMCSDKGVGIYDLIDAGWVCGAPAVAHTDIVEQVERRHKFFDLVNQIVEQSKDPELEKVVTILRNPKLSTC